MKNIRQNIKVEKKIPAQKLVKSRTIVIDLHDPLWTDIPIV